MGFLLGISVTFNILAFCLYRSVIKELRKEIENFKKKYAKEHKAN